MIITAIVLMLMDKVLVVNELMVSILRNRLSFVSKQKSTLVENFNGAQTEPE